MRPFTFLMNKGWRNNEDRGGIMYGVQAFLEEFSSKDNILLIIKVNPAYGVSNIQQLLNELIPKDKKDLPLIKIMVDNIPYNKMADFYNMGDVLVMPSRSETFGLPGIEAMACELPVITTNFGGQTDFCTEENGWIVGGELEEVQHEILYEGIKWLTPSIPELRKAMRQAYNREHLKERISCALETAQKFTWDKSALLIQSLV